MDLNSDFSMQEVLRIAQSPAGQQLLSILRRQSGDGLQHVMNCASAGDYQKAKEALASLLDSEEAKQLLKQLEGDHG